MVKVKICGITNLRDAEAAVAYGADALGFVFAPSPRRVDSQTVRAIAKKIGPYVTKVGVFVNASAEKILATAASCRLDAVQLHGDESPAQCQALKRYTLIKAFRVGRNFSPRITRRYPVDAYLLEADSSERGGTGKVWDWPKLRKIRFDKPVIVSGGLRPGNVRRAIRLLKPYAVDVSSGIERTAGRKNHRLMKAFIRYAKGR